MELDYGILYYLDRSAPCRSELQELSRRKQELHTVAVRGREWAEQVAWRSPMPPPSWRLRGSLVAHLHEHRGAISRYVIVSLTTKKNNRLRPGHHCLLKTTLGK